MLFTFCVKILICRNIEEIGVIDLVVYLPMKVNKTNYFYHDKESIVPIDLFIFLFCLEVLMMSTKR